MDWTHIALELRSKTVIEEKIDRKRSRQRRRKKIRENLRERRIYWTLTEEALHRTFWKTRFGKGNDLSQDSLGDDGSTVSLPQDVAHLPQSTSILFSYVHNITVFSNTVQ